MDGFCRRVFLPGLIAAGLSTGTGVDDASATRFKPMAPADKQESSNDRPAQSTREILQALKEQFAQEGDGADPKARPLPRPPVKIDRSVSRGQKT